jgi:5-bromo-4-chloroindolyl phosphate hydrolysis protein
MSQRFGGKYSPPPNSEGTPVPKRRRTKIGARVNSLFFAPLPLAFLAFGKEPVGMTLSLAAFGLLIAAAWTLREGLKAEEAYEARSIAKRPAIPRKLFASAMTGAGLALAGYTNGVGFVGIALFGVLGAVLHSLAFGPDPMKDKGATGVSDFESERVARAVEVAEAHLARMSDAILLAQDRSLERKVSDFQTSARAMFRQVEDDPRDLTAARKYLSIYLEGASDATVKFADLYSRSRDSQARSDFIALLDDLSTNFNARRKDLLRDDRTALDVEIEVLRERLEREGVQARNSQD